MALFQVEFKGLSGPIEFKEGRRIQFKLDLLKLKQHALVKVGEWRPGAGVNITDRAAFFDPGTMNVTLVVTTILVREFATRRGCSALLLCECYSCACACRVEGCRN